jgi:hypothetical protein
MSNALGLPVLEANRVGYKGLVLFKQKVAMDIYLYTRDYTGCRADHHLPRESSRSFGFN